MSEPLLFEKTRPGRKGYSLPALDIPAERDEALIPSKYGRKTPASLPELTENEVVRHFIRISTLNHHIDKGFYPLGSCTMKYNPKVNEAAAAFPGFRSIHPLEPAPLVQGALQIMDELSGYLKEIVGMEAVSLQPAAGAQGELSSLLMIRKYHEKQGRARKTILVPDSAHGTNPASVTMAAYQTVTIRSNSKGMVDLEDLRRHLNEDVAGLMLTNPNTLGIFEKQILEIQKQIHAVGALMYMDGANLNALLGITRPGDMGFDCVHMNLHKTFSTPHGGGGPGAGPIAVNRLLEPFLPVPRILKVGTRYMLDSDRADSIGKIHSFYGNFGMHVRAYTYIRMHGARGLREVGENAILNANYLLSRLKDHFELPYKETPMHEFVLSTERQRALGVRVTDIAKRLLDFGVHAPTVHFPLIVREALMIEPTETETKETLDAFADALIQINEEIRANPEIVLKAPHTTPVRRLDEARAARQVDVCFRD